jgi:hypothetical protein
MLIKDAEQLRNLTGSYYANNDFEKIETTLQTVEDEMADVIGRDMMAQLAREADGEPCTMTITTDDDQQLRIGDTEITVDADGNVRFKGYSPYGIQTRVEGDAVRIFNSRAVVACQQAVGYMATMRFYRLNDISHENTGRKVKIDRENEARPFEWQLARDDRAHLEEYYRALDRLMRALEEDPRFRQTQTWKRRDALIIKDADSLNYLTGLDPSPWLYHRLVPFLAESQHFVAKAYAPSVLSGLPAENTDLQHAAQMAVALGALALMGRRTSLQTMPYGLMKLFENNGGGNRQEAAAIDRLDDYLRTLSREQHYWLNEMKQLRDQSALGGSPTENTYLHMPDNQPHDKFMRL